MNSSMIATEPIPQDIWESIGWQGRETLGDTAHGFFYAQRTVDDRIAIGGRSVPYRFAFAHRRRRAGAASAPSRTSPRSLHVGAAADPRDIPIAHAWCGVLAVPPELGGMRNLRQGNGFGLPPAVTSATASPPPTWPGAP